MITEKDSQGLDQGWPIDDPLYKKIYDEAEPLLRARLNDIHARICYHYALELLDEEGGDPRIVLPAILLHDVGYSSIPDDELQSSFGPKIENPALRRQHETEGARLAGIILKKVQYPEELIEEIQTIIDGHDTRDDALSLNDKITKDADKLFRYSYEGFRIDFKRFNLKASEWFDYLIAHISGWFFTETATKLASQASKDLEKALKDRQDF
jgi:HD superfamily phosphodiesterase